MDERCGRAAIIEHAGPLYTGDAGSGESEIRRWILRNDLLEAIIALPVDLFYNTGLQTYIWILSKNKSPRRRGKVQLIDASSFCKPLRKKLGDKKNEISPENREAVTRLYTDFRENEFVKIFDNEDFLYREYTVMRPQYDESGKVVRDRKGEIVYDKATKDKEIVPFKESIEDYMAREVLPHVPDAKAFFLEDLTKKKPVVKTGAEFPFTRYFYKYASLEPAAEIWSEIESLDREIAKELKALKEEA
jgi:type I restriction enzyme M protein